MKILIKNGIIVNEGLSFRGSLLINDNIIEKIIRQSDFATDQLYDEAVEECVKNCREGEMEIIEAAGLHVLPGVIDDQVHFREPGNTHKATIESESAAAVLGGVTSFMDMPNNNPPVTTVLSLEEKYSRAAETSYANYSFYLGATNDNIEEIKKLNPRQICGVKLFMGSSTGNMLVNEEKALNLIFKESPLLIAAHCEDEQTIKDNLAKAKAEYGNSVPFEMHPVIRSREACIRCSKKAIDLAVKSSCELHLLHVSTAEELQMIKEAQKVNPHISGEVCVHYMWFNKADYTKYGSKVKCNPAIKDKSDMLALRNAVKEGLIKVVATDHAPHLREEKDQPYLASPSGLPLVQHSLQVMLELCSQGVFTLEEVVARMSHGPSDLFKICGRGYIREGFFADLVLVDLNLPNSCSTLSPAYKCGWSPFEGFTFGSSIVHTFVNGHCVVKSGRLQKIRTAMRLEFNR